MIKLLVTFGIYLVFVLTLGLVLALTASREGMDRELQDDE
jgi:hypothetical protein